MLYDRVMRATPATPAVGRDDRRHRRRQHRQARRMALAARRPRQPDRHISLPRARASSHSACPWIPRRAPAKRSACAPRSRCSNPPTSAAPNRHSSCAGCSASPARAATRTHTWRRRCRRTAMSCCRRTSASPRRAVENPNCQRGCFRLATRARCASRARRDIVAAPTPVLARAAAAVGHTQTIADGDGTVRSDAAALRVGEDALLPSLATAVAARAFGVAPAEIDFRFGKRTASRRARASARAQH